MLKPNQVETYFEEAEANISSLKVNKDATVYEPKPGEVLLFNIQQCGIDWPNEIAEDTFKWQKGRNIKIWNHNYKRLTSNVFTWNDQKRINEVSKDFQKHTYTNKDKTIGIVHYTGTIEGINHEPVMLFTHDPTTNTYHALNDTTKNIEKATQSMLTDENFPLLSTSQTVSHSTGIQIDSVNTEKTPIGDTLQTECDHLTTHSSNLNTMVKDSEIKLPTKLTSPTNTTKNSHETQMSNTSVVIQNDMDHFMADDQITITNEDGNKDTFMDCKETTLTIKEEAYEIYLNNDFQFTKEADGVIVTDLSNNQFLVNVGQCKCECGTKACSHFRAALRKLNMTKDFEDPFTLPRGLKRKSKKALLDSTEQSTTKRTAEWILSIDTENPHYDLYEMEISNPGLKQNSCHLKSLHDGKEQSLNKELLTEENATTPLNLEVSKSASHTKEIPKNDDILESNILSEIENTTHQITNTVVTEVKIQKFVNDEFLRSKPWEIVSPEEKEYFSKLAGTRDLQWNVFNRHPHTYLLGNQNQIIGEIPAIEENLTHLSLLDKNNDESLLFKISNNQAVLFVQHSKIADEALMESCAMIINNTYIDKESKRAVNIGCQTINGDLKDAAAKMKLEMTEFLNSNSEKGHKSKNPMAELKMETYNITCYCNEVKKDKNKVKMYTCTNCKETFHKACVGKQSNDFQCSSCSLQTKGIKWSANPERVVNTCHFDSTLTSLAIMCEKNPTYKKEIELLTKNSNLLIKAFANATLEAVNNDSFKAQATWANAVMVDRITKGIQDELPYKIDMFNSPLDFFHLLPDLSEFEMKALNACPDCHCQDKKFVNSINIPVTTDPLKYIQQESEIFNNTEAECINTAFLKCPRNHLQSKLHISKEKKPLWLVIKNSGSLQGPDFFFNLPKEVKIDDEIFQLSSIVIHDDAKSHYTSLQHVDGNFIFYDGLMGQTSDLPQKKEKKDTYHRIISKGDYIGQRINVDHVLYLRTINGEVR